MERILAILSEEPEYSQELAAYLSSRRDFLFRPVVFTNVEAYCDYVRTHKVDMLICDEDIADYLDGDTVADATCILMPNTYVAEEQEYPTIFKYQSSEAVMREIIRYYTGKGKITPANGKDGSENGETKIISVCSPVGGCYKSTFALALAKYYSNGGRTLFLSFDPFFTFPKEVKSPSDKNLTDILYYLQSCTRDPVSFVGRMSKKQGNLEYIGGAAHWFDITELKPNHIARLFEAIKWNKYYDSIVLDLSADNAACLEMLSSSQRILTPIGMGLKGTQKINEWKRQLGFIGRVDVLEKIREINIPRDEELAGDFSFDQLTRGRMGSFIEEMEGLQYIK